MMINCIHNQRRTLAGLVVFIGLFCLPPSLKADQWGDWTYSTDGSNVTITGYTGTNGDIMIPVTISDMSVIAIGDYAFTNRTSLTGINIPYSVSTIGKLAFYFCTSLAEITLPTCVVSIGDSAFSSSGLTNIIIPNSVTSIGAHAFNNCFKLASITMSTNLTSIRNGLFSQCTNLTSVTIPNSVTNIEDYAFNKCSLLTNITIPNGVSSIRKYVFFNCNSLTSIIIPDSVISIGDSAFGQCYSLANITIPNGVTNIGANAFKLCSDLPSVIIPNRVSNIGSNAFDYCTSLTNVTIGANITIIGTNAFQSCFILTGVYFKGNVPAFGLNVFSNADSVLVYYYPWTLGWTNTFGERPTQVNPAYTQWLNNYGFTTSLTNDYDNDGMFNWQEFLAGTGPTNDADRLAIASMGSGTNAQISWQAKSNVSYQVRKSLDLMGAWLDAPTGAGTTQRAFQTAPADGLMQYADPDYAGVTNGFYRVNVVP